MENSQDKTTIKKVPQKIKKIQCFKHGEYESTMILVRDSEIWPGCPDCHKEQEMIRMSEASQKISWLSKRRVSMSLVNYERTTEDQERIYQRALQYVSNFEKVKNLGSCICMLGAPGTGKTHLATAIGIAITNNNYSVSYQRFYDLMIKIKSTYNKSATETEQELIKRLIQFDLLIIDEVGLKTLTETETAIAYQIIDKRYEEIKPTIIISNLSEKELADNLGARTIDRIYENHGAIFIFNWDSHRRL